MIRLLAILLLSLLLTACSNNLNRGGFNPSNVNALAGMTTLNTPIDEGVAYNISSIRMQALKEGALSLGAQSGLAQHAKKINHSLANETEELDQIYRFNDLLINHNILPPVLAEGDQVFNMDDPDTIRIADKTYRIITQARFVTVPPNWRTYLILQYSKPQLPDASLLPRNCNEQKVWAEYIHKGWENGIKQANVIFQDNLARLKRDYTGMVLYRELLTRNMVSKPFVATTRLGVTSNVDGSQMSINDKVLHITALPHLNAQSKTWTPVITK